MMVRVVQLGRVRAALARLDRVTREHPELTGEAARARLARAPCLATDPRGEVPDDREEGTPVDKPEA